MQFPNAAKGVKQIFTAEILALIAGLCSFIVAILTVAADSVTTQGAAAGLVAGILILTLGIGVLGIISFIMNLVGLGNAKKDETNFKTAFIIALVAIVIAFLGAIFSTNTVVANLCTALASICGLLVAFFSINGIKALAGQLDDQAMVAKGQKVLTLLLITWGLSIILELIGVFFSGSDTAAVIAAVLALIGAVFAIVSYILYLSYLAKAKKMLA